jgi:hypothetical protein
MTDITFFGIIILTVVGIFLYRNRKKTTAPHNIETPVPPVPPIVPFYPSYEATYEQCSGELATKVMYDTVYRVYVAGEYELNTFQKIRLQTIWTYSNGEVAYTYDTGLIEVTELSILNGVFYYEGPSISIEINATQAELTSHTTISVFDGNTMVQVGQDTQFIHDILFPCGN